MKIFSGFMSQWRMGGSKECKNNKAVETSNIKLNLVFIEIWFLWLPKKFLKFYLGYNWEIMYNSPYSSIEKPKTLIICGWFNLSRMRISFKIIFIYLISIEPNDIFFIATLRYLYTPLKTIEVAPYEIWSPILTSFIEIIKFGDNFFILFNKVYLIIFL